MRHFIDFRYEAGTVVALTNDGLMAVTTSGQDDKFSPWELLPAAPQDGYDDAHSIAAEAADARLVGMASLIDETFTRFSKAMAETRAGAPPPRYESGVQYDPELRGPGGCVNPICVLDHGHQGDCQRELPKTAPPPDADLVEEHGPPPVENDPSVP